MREWRYNSTILDLLSGLRVSVEIHAQPVLLPGKKLPVLIAQNARRAQKPVWIV
jgi:hypothetical protein